MNLNEHLLIVLSEECTEIIELIVDGGNVKDEVNDLMGCYELSIEEKMFPKITDYNNKIISNYEIMKHLLKVQYFISKSLRFGLNECYPGSHTRNYDEILTNLTPVFSRFKSILDPELIENKKSKIKHFIGFSIQNECLKID